MPLDAAKFRDPLRTARGEVRAQVSLAALRTLWINTGTLCNLACRTCYIESSPKNDALVYPALAEVESYLDEAQALGTREIGFTGGEPFMNPDAVAMIAAALSRGFDVLVLTNAMRPMRRHEAALSALRERHGETLTLRVPSSAVRIASTAPRTSRSSFDPTRATRPRSTICPLASCQKAAPISNSLAPGTSFASLCRTACNRPGSTLGRRWASVFRTAGCARGSDGAPGGTNAPAKLSATKLNVTASK